MIELIQFIVEVGLHEVVRAVIWGTIGVVVSLVASIAWLVFCWISVKKLKLFRDDVWGRWGRRVLAVLWICGVPGPAITQGAFIGLTVAAEKTILQQRILENGFQEALTPPIRSFLLEPGDDSEFQFEVVDGEVSVSEVIAAIDETENGLAERLLSTFRVTENADTSNVPKWVMAWINKGIARISNSDNVSIADILNGIREVLYAAKQMDEKNDDLVSPEEIAWSVGSVHGVNFLHAFISRIRLQTILISALMAVGSVLLALGLCWGVSNVLRKMLEKAQQSSQK